MLAGFGRVLLVAALLLAQQTAFVHEVRHVAGFPQAADAKSPAPKGDRLCSLHDLLGTVVAVAGGAAPLVAFLSLSEPRFAAAPAAAREAFPLSPHSRGPPLIS